MEVVHCRGNNKIDIAKRIQGEACRIEEKSTNPIIKLAK
jgi:hypothetical protein